MTSRLMAMMHVLEEDPSSCSPLSCVLVNHLLPSQCAAAQCLACIQAHPPYCCTTGKHPRLWHVLALWASPVNAAEGTSRGLDQPCFQQEILLLQHRQP